MRRILLPIVLATLAFPAAAHASVLSTVSNGTLTITGDAADDRIIVKPGSAGSVLVNDQSFAGVSKLAINSGAGADEIRIDSLALPATIESGPGADVIAGGPGPETIVAGDDADLVDGGAGQDTILLGAGNDTALETDGSVDGQSGTDTVRVSGTDESEEFTLQALGTHARIVRDTGGLADLVRVETAELFAGGGPDLVDIGDLSATELTRIDADLGLFDGAPDSVFASGTDANDGIGASMLGDAIRVSGLKADVRVENADADRVTVQARGGDDKLTAIGDVPGLTLEGNEGADDLTGATAAETLRGGPGNDRARGNGGADRIELGDGDDVATFRLTDGADTITGDGGVDRLAVQGTTADELVEVRATQVGAANVAGVETVEPAPGSGRDTVAVGDLTGSAIRTVAVDLGGLDSRVDTVSITGTEGPDKIKLAASGAGHAVTGLAATVTVDTTDPGQKIVVDAGDGDDEVDASEHDQGQDPAVPVRRARQGRRDRLARAGRDRRRHRGRRGAARRRPGHLQLDRRRRQRHRRGRGRHRLPAHGRHVRGRELQRHPHRGPRARGAQYRGRRPRRRRAARRAPGGRRGPDARRRHERHRRHQRRLPAHARARHDHPRRQPGQRARRRHERQRRDHR